VKRLRNTQNKMPFNNKKHAEESQYSKGDKFEESGGISGCVYFFERCKGNAFEMEEQYLSHCSSNLRRVNGA